MHSTRQPISSNKSPEEQLILVSVQTGAVWITTTDQVTEGITIEIKKRQENMGRHAWSRL